LEQSSTGVQIDSLNVVIPVFQQMLERPSREAFQGGSIAVADVQSLLLPLLRLIAFRPINQENILALFVANAWRIDLRWGRDQSATAGFDPDRMSEFADLVREFYRD